MAREGRERHRREREGVHWLEGAVVMDEETSTTAPDELSQAAPARACLVQIYGGELGRRHIIDQEITVGRDDTNTVVLEVASVSRRHARVFARDGACWLGDLGSTNGSFVNDREIDGEVELVNGDLIKLGGAVFKFVAGGNIEALYHEEIYLLTILDGLTGVHNKRFLLEFLEREMARALRHGRNLSLAMIDIDNFKQLNDTYGHLAGDAVLKRIARLISQRTRREELVARYGGEEFALVLPETGSPGVRTFCEKIRRLIASEHFEFDSATIRTTVSIGVAAISCAHSVEELIKIADHNLYRAKAAGRNRVVLE
jgi:two-component system cell cycle response regulator